MTAISSQIVANNSDVYAEIAYQDPKRNRPEGVLDSDLISTKWKRALERKKDRIRLTSDGKRFEMLEGLAIVKNGAFVVMTLQFVIQIYFWEGGRKPIVVSRFDTGERKLFTLPNSP